MQDRSDAVQCTGRMLYRTTARQVSSKTERMQGRTDAVQDRIYSIQDRSVAGQDRCVTGRMQDRRDPGHGGCRTGRMQETSHSAWMAGQFLLRAKKTNQKVSFTYEKMVAVCVVHIAEFIRCRESPVLKGDGLSLH